MQDLILTSNRYHPVYDSQILTEDQKVLLQGFQELIELGVENYKKGVSQPISEQDIIRVFSRLGGGNRIYILGDGRNVLEWWRNGRPSTGIIADTSFNERLRQFNERIKFIADNGPDTERFLINYYRDHGSTYYPTAIRQVENYLWMAENSRHLHYLVHLEDVKNIARIFAVQFPI